jgi:uncharacterized membrane protein
VTEFYVLSADGLVENYPRQVAPDEPMLVLVGITNREGRSGRYRVIMRAGQPAHELAPTDWLTVERDATWQAPLRYTLPRAGDDQAVDIVLFYDDQPEPYRRLRLWVNVRQPPGE